MNDPIDFTSRQGQTEKRAQDPDAAVHPASKGIPSNAVYARVGDAVLLTAQEGVRRGLTAQDIIHEIHAVHGVGLNVSDLRLLLASRRI